MVGLPGCPNSRPSWGGVGIATEAGTPAPPWSRKSAAARSGASACRDRKHRRAVRSRCEEIRQILRNRSDRPGAPSADPRAVYVQLARSLSGLRRRRGRGATGSASRRSPIPPAGMRAPTLRAATDRSSGRSRGTFWGRIFLQKLLDCVAEPQLRRQMSILPCVQSCSMYPQLLGDVRLPESQLAPSLPQVIAECYDTARVWRAAQLSPR